MFLVLPFDSRRFHNPTIFFCVYHCIWHSGHSLHIWQFLEPADQLRVAWCSYSLYIGFADNVSDILNDPAVSDDAPPAAPPSGGDSQSDRGDG